MASEDLILRKYSALAFRNPLIPTVPTLSVCPASCRSNLRRRAGLLDPVLCAFLIASPSVVGCGAVLSSRQVFGCVEACESEAKQDDVKVNATFPTQLWQLQPRRILRARCTLAAWTAVRICQIGQNRRFACRLRCASRGRAVRNCSFGEVGYERGTRHRNCSASARPLQPSARGTVCVRARWLPASFRELRYVTWSLRLPTAVALDQRLGPALLRTLVSTRRDRDRLDTIERSHRLLVIRHCGQAISFQVASCLDDGAWRSREVVSPTRCGRNGRFAVRCSFARTR